MSGKTQALENEIAEMEDRLANVKVKVEIEREAWKKSYRTGKKGTKWKSAAGAQASKNSPPGSSSSAADDKSTKDSETNETIMPSYWDALELAQYLQTKQLTAFAQVVIYEQITGKALLDTPPGKMRQLFQDVISSNTDPNWKIFLQVTSKLHKLQKKLEKSSSALSGRSASKEGAGRDLLSPASPRGAPTLFPLISPRMPNLTATSIKTSVTQDSDDRDSIKPRMKTAMPMRKPPANGQQLATCWNCGTRFPRSQGSVRGGGSSSSKALSTRTFCSKECQSAIENADISISSSVSASLQVCSARDSKDFTSHPHGGVPNKSRSFHKPQQKTKSEGNGFPSKPSVEGLSDFLQVAHKGSVDEVPRPPASSSSRKPNGAVLRKRIMGAGASPSSSPSVASISSTRGGSLQPGSIPPLMLTSFNDSSRQSKVYQQSKYKLDPELFQANGITLASCFYNGAAASGTSFTRKNLMKLQEYISVKTLHHLSLTSRSWFEAIHQSSLADPLWGFHLLRTWKRTDEDETFLYEIGALTKAERPRQMMMKLTRKVGRLVLENMKVLLNPENWHLATPMSSHPSVTLQSVLRVSRPSATRMLAGGGCGRLSPPKTDLTSLLSASMFEQIALIYNRKGEIVAVRAQELIRPVADDQMLTDILHGVRTGSLSTVECRRLRLFSAANRLPFDEWHALPQCKVVFDFFWSPSSNSSTTSASSSESLHGAVSGTPIPRVWHQKILERMQKTMQQRLLGKESVQQVLKAIDERNGPPQVLIALEKFLTGCHATGMMATHAAKKKKEPQQQQQSPTMRVHG